MEPVITNLEETSQFYIFNNFSSEMQRSSRRRRKRRKQPIPPLLLQKSMVVGVPRCTATDGSHFNLKAPVNS
jgi:hypothetical protein